MNLSFAGCGFMGIYHIGVAACLRKYAPDLYLNKVSGASAGAMAAACLLCDSPLGEITSHVLEVAMQARSRVLGPFSPSFDIHQLLTAGLKKTLPEDAHLRVNGKIHISVTRVYDGKNIILSHFETKEELIQALTCSSFIPFFSGIIPPKFRGVRYMDGGLSDNLLVLDEKTITVSPFCGESDICPRDLETSRLFHVRKLSDERHRNVDKAFLRQVMYANTSIELSRTNLYRLAHIMFPPRPETLSMICQQGFDDARAFLQSNNLIGCFDCVSSSNLVALAGEPAKLDCTECENQKKMVVLDRLPETVVLTLEGAINQEIGVIHRLMNRSGIRFFSYLTLPYTLPAGVMFSTTRRLISKTSTALTFTHKFKHVTDLLRMVVVELLTDKNGLTCIHRASNFNNKSTIWSMTQSPIQSNRKSLESLLR